MNEILLQIYFSANLFIAGYQLKSNLDDAVIDYAERPSETLYNYVILLLSTLVYIALGIVILIVTFVYYFIIEAFKSINYTFQLDFWWSWYFTKKWENVDVEKLEFLNKRGKRKKKNTLHGRIYLYGLDLINKKNNYTYTDEP